MEAERRRVETAAIESKLRTYPRSQATGARWKSPEWHGHEHEDEITPRST